MISQRELKATENIPALAGKLLLMRTVKRASQDLTQLSGEL